MSRKRERKKENDRTKCLGMTIKISSCFFDGFTFAQPLVKSKKKNFKPFITVQLILLLAT